MPMPGKPTMAVVQRIATPSEENRMFPKAALASGALSRVRNHQQLLQLDVAEKLAVSQPHVANMEQKTDMLLSTLQRYVKALGGQLELVARFEDVSFHLSPRKGPDRVL
jgi:predicted XRE-type DNA-binding protein